MESGDDSTADRAADRASDPDVRSALDVLPQDGNTDDPADRWLVWLRWVAFAGMAATIVVGSVIVLAALPWATQAMQWLDPTPARLVANTHLAFNILLAVAALPLLPAFEI